MNTTRRYQATRRSAAAFAAAALATVATLGSTLALFASVAATPWLPTSQAALVEHCDVERRTSQRLACVQAAVFAQRGTLHVASR
jgi:hypothetical protein